MLFASVPRIPSPPWWPDPALVGAERRESVITVWSILPASIFTAPSFSTGLGRQHPRRRKSRRGARNMPLISYDPRTPQISAPTGMALLCQGRYPAHAGFPRHRACGKRRSGTEPMPQRRSSLIISLAFPATGGGHTAFLALRDEGGGARLEPHYFPGAAQPGHRPEVAELGL